MTNNFPDQFSGPYPHTDELRKIACRRLPTKQQQEEEWIKANAPNFSKNLEGFVTNLFPKVLVRIIFEYADPKPTLLDV